MLHLGWLLPAERPPSPAAAHTRPRECAGEPGLEALLLDISVVLLMKGHLKRGAEGQGELPA